jgi:hypothetical protein
MLYTISEAAKAMGLEESLILKAIEDGVITATKKASDEWHVDICTLHEITAKISGKQMREAVERIRRLRSELLPTVTKPQLSKNEATRGR